ncbi:MAG: SAM-dependent methyltransferase [Gammaproteobacteria bacterium]
MSSPDSTPPLATIFMLSAAALAYEVLLVRLFSIIHWHHFAFMVISIALLGYGASGSMITVFQRGLLQRYNSVLILNAVMFGLSAIACFIAVQQMPFNALEILWDTSQWQRLLMSYLLLTLPFFFVANAIALTMARYHDRIALVYGVDLIGAGTGAIAILLLLQFSPPSAVLRIVGVLGILAGLLAIHKLTRLGRIIVSSSLVLFSVIILFAPADWFELRLSEFKGLEQVLLINGTKQLQRHSSSISQIDVIESTAVPLRNAPGMSLMSPAEIPDQLAVFQDGDEMTTIDKRDGNTSLAYQDYMSSALPYHMQTAPEKVLVLGSSTGSELLQAALHNAAHIDAVETETQLTRLITDEYADYFGWHQISDRIRFHTISPRGYAAVTEEKYNIIVTGLAGASGGGAAGVHELATSYDVTVEALQKYLGLLEPDGLLSITFWTSTPPRENLRLFATVVEAMRRSGIDHPEDNIAWIRSWNTATLVIKHGVLTADEMERVRDFSTARAFDIAWLPDIKQNEVNRYQLLEQPVFYLAAKALLSESAQDFIDSYKYNIASVSDNNPYFSNTFKWSSLPELLNISGRGGIAMIGVGYPTLLFTLVQAVIAAIVLILLPLAFIKQKKSSRLSGRRNIVIYFISLGLAFLFIELAFIQKFTLILSQPLYAVAVTLCAFLIFSGLGSLYVQHRIASAQPQRIYRLLTQSVAAIATITLVYIMVLPYVTDFIMALSEPLRVAAAILLAAPLAFVMGMPFPLGLAGTRVNNPQLMPWAWGINGCASVLSAILAILLAIEIGFSGVMLSAILLYVLAWLSQPIVDSG